MRITGSQVGPVNPVDPVKLKKVNPTSGPEVASSMDQVVLSADVGAVEAARAAIAAAPEIREEKVEAIRRQMREGAYRVSPDTIAERILAEGRYSKLGRK
jgi:negative regulator of flagellin synthesis FlgM